MPGATPTPDADKAKPMTAAEAAKRVRRTVQVKDDKDKLVTKKVPVAVDEVLDFKDYGSHVVVVTTDGQKLSNLQGE